MVFLLVFLQLVFLQLINCPTVAAATATTGSTTTTKDFCIVGGGPGGLQIANFLAENNNDFVLFEKNDNGGSMFRKFPIHRKLISINKRATARGHSDTFNERHDWNSLLSSNRSLVVGEYSKVFYPHADDYVRYLEDYAEHLKRISPKESIQFSTEVTHVTRTPNTDQYLNVYTRSVKEQDEDVEQQQQQEEETMTTCHHLIWATGLQPKGLDWLEEGKDLEGVEFYDQVDGTNQRYFNESVALIGAGK
jgi:thioredoxin reductase